MKPSFFVFLGLNVQRLASLVAIILVFAATIKIMVDDGRAMKALSADLGATTTAGSGSGDASNSTITTVDCEYYEGTDVPTHVGGLFWAQLNRFFILVLLVVCFFSEISWRGISDRFFAWGLPILGPSFGTAPLGVLQMFLASTMLSHYLDAFQLGVSWFLFIVGVLNLLLGSFFHAPLKDQRSIYAARRERAKQRDIEAVDGGTRPSAPTNVLRALGSKSARPPHPQIIRSALDAFPTLETASQSELLRQRAREANERLERSRGSIPPSPPGAQGVHERAVARAQAGASRDLEPPPRPAPPSAVEVLSAAASRTRRRSASFVRKARHRVSAAPSLRLRGRTEAQRQADAEAPPLPSEREEGDDDAAEMVQLAPTSLPGSAALHPTSPTTTLAPSYRTAPAPHATPVANKFVSEWARPAARETGRV